LPGVREAIEEERWEDADRYVAITAAALQEYANRLDSAVQLINSPSATAQR
jgi:N-acetylated-alpha-linked acidic dipeptidase